MVFLFHRFSCLLTACFILIIFSPWPSDSLPSFPSRKSQFFRLHGDDLDAEIFHSPETFKLNYAQMEREFNVFVYPYMDISSHIRFHSEEKLTGYYASEGYFFRNIFQSRFLTEDPNKAHLFFIPISCQKLKTEEDSDRNTIITVKNYVQRLIAELPYWNRTLGADHFFVTCDDIGVKATEAVPFLAKNSIRVVCFAPHYGPDSGYIPHKDVALPQVLQPFVFPAGGNDFKHRTDLAFWAGYCTSKVRSQLTALWQMDEELEIQSKYIDKRNVTLMYETTFHRTKFCICPKSYQVNTVCIADVIHYGCVPVIMSDFYDLPFNDILDWSKFSVILREDNVSELKFILGRLVSNGKFIELHRNTVKAQKHFQWNSPPIRYDAFHMVMYELWLRHNVVKYS